MFIFEEPSTSILAGIILSIVFCGIQLFLCFKSKSVLLKKTPSIIVLCFIAIMILMLTGVFGKGTGFLGNVHLIAVGILGIIIAFASIGIAIALLIYRCVTKQHK